MIVPVMDAEADTCGGKAGALGALLRAGLPVPDGFVVPFDAYRAVVGGLDLGPLLAGPGGPDAVRQAIEMCPVEAGLRDALGRGLEGLGDPPVAVRSSAANEDTAEASAAGQHESILAVHGTSGVVDAVRACWASLYGRRAIEYRNAIGHGDSPVMAVLVQRHVDAEASGVMFTATNPDGVTQIEASWGLGASVVGGAVTPDTYHIGARGTVARTVVDKRTRLDRHGTRLVTRDVPTAARSQPSVGDETAAQLARLGNRAAAVLGGPQDIEWAIAARRIWLLQARPVTAPPPPRSGVPTTSPATLAGTPGSHGIATGIARIVRGPDDFTRVRPGDILVCPYTDPAWTPLLRVAAGVVTETGGVLCHAAIVARERHIPAVLGLSNATTRLRDGATITINGTTGSITTAPA
jgi:pyruvate,water dikinase